MKKWGWLAITSALVALAGLSLILPALSAAPPQSGLLTLKIHDTFPGASSGVRGDGERHETMTDPFTFYVDHRLAGGDPCVTAAVDASGFSFIRLDRRLNANQDIPDCANTWPATPRTFISQLQGSACTALGLTSPCVLRLAPQMGEEPFISPRIRLSKLFSSKKRTPVAFLFQLQSNLTQYELRSDADLTFSRVGNVWNFTNNAASGGGGGQSFSLWRIEGPGPPCPCKDAGPFDLLFSIVVNKP